MVFLPPEGGEAVNVPAGYYLGTRVKLGAGAGTEPNGDLFGKPVQVRFWQVTQHYRIGEVIADHLPTYLVLQVKLVAVIGQQALQVPRYQEAL